MTTPNNDQPTYQPPFITPPSCNTQQYIPVVTQSQESPSTLHISAETTTESQINSFIAYHEPEYEHQTPQRPLRTTTVPTAPIV